MASTRGASSVGVASASSALLFALLCDAGRAQAQVQVQVQVQAQAAEPASRASTPQGPTSREPTEVANTSSTPEPVSNVQPMQPARGMVLVHVSAGEHPFAVFFGKGKQPIADCVATCDFWAWPEKYRVLVQQGEGPYDDASLALRIRGPGSYAFVPAHGSAQNAGLILGAAGPIIGFAGLAFTAAGLLASCDAPPGQSCDKPLSLYIGLSGLAVGAAMTAIGWPLYLHNRAYFRVSDSPAKIAPRVGVVPMPRGGVGLGASLAF